MAATELLSFAKARDLLDYCHETGVIQWRASIGTARAGNVAGCIGRDGYREIKISGITYRAHRLAWLHFYGEWPKQCIDHINGIRTDNRIVNLRDVPKSTNSQNLRKVRPNNKSTGLLGAYPQNRRWIAKIRVAGRQIHIGTFDTPEAAHAAYVEEKRRSHIGCTI